MADAGGAGALAAAYFGKGDDAFTGGVGKACFGCDDKHFNQQFQSGYRHLAYPRTAPSTN